MIWYMYNTEEYSDFTITYQVAVVVQQKSVAEWSAVVWSLVEWSVVEWSVVEQVWWGLKRHQLSFNRRTPVSFMTEYTVGNMIVRKIAIEMNDSTRS